jgi:transaldolase
MANESYLQWLVRATPTTWWHDSADPDELRKGLEHSATGVTTNPLLASRTLRGRPDIWADALKAVPKDVPNERRAEELMSHVVKRAAQMLLPQTRAKGRLGYVCVGPAAGPRTAHGGRHAGAWAPNVP